MCDCDTQWCCRACFAPERPGDGQKGAAVVGPHPENPGVCARGLHAWHRPLHVLSASGRNVRPAPRRHGVRRRAPGHALMLCRVPGCTNEKCCFAHSEEELAHWRAGPAPPPAAHMFHPVLARVLSDLGIAQPVTDNVRERLHAHDLDETLRRVRPLVSSDTAAAALRATGGGHAALLGALRGPAPPPPPAWDAWAWPQWDALRQEAEKAALPPTPCRAGPALLAWLQEAWLEIEC